MAMVWKFEDGLKLSIWGKIVGFLLQDMDFMIRTAMAIKKAIEDAWSIRDSGVSGKRKEDKPSFIRERSRRLLFHTDFRNGAATIKAKAESGLLAIRGR